MLMSNVPPTPGQDPNQGMPPGSTPPQPGPYQQPPMASPDNGFSNLQLNLWLSVFFSWIPALIFWIVDKDKTANPVRKANADNFSFQLLRTGIIVAAWILLFIPVLGWIIYILALLVELGLFIVAIVNAVNVPKAIKEGQEAKVIFNFGWIK
jgi:uncharacterized membrane protein